MKAFKKYWAIFQITLTNSLAYPGELIGRSLMIIPFMWIFCGNRKPAVLGRYSAEYTYPTRSMSPSARGFAIANVVLVLGWLASAISVGRRYRALTESKASKTLGDAA